MRTNIISVDVEDWFSSGHLRLFVSPEQCVSRIEHTVQPILRMLAEKEIKATFFVLGSVAKLKPGLIREVSMQGHEIASHGYEHIPLWQSGMDKTLKDIQLTNKILQDITGKKVKGFRAPYASLNKGTSWLISLLEAEGFEYDSSIFPMRTPLYGVSGAPETIYRISADNILQHNPNAKLIEIPFTVWRLGLLKIPCTGGIYGRFLPFSVLRFLLKRVERKRPVNFYFHPWETDPAMPVIDVPVKNKIVAYYNVSTYLKKIDRLAGSFEFTSFERYLATHK